MNNHEAIQYLYDLSSLGWKLGLNKIRALLTELNNPHLAYKIIHVTGTNGKGSTCAILESILHEAGYSTGLFTSPHLINVCERIKFNQKNIDFDEFVLYIDRLKPLIEKYKCTFFEAITAIAFTFFADQHVETAVVEVGLGGRLDATNVVTPILSLITNVELDHTHLLGKTREKIAYEKAGIIKENINCLTMSNHKTVINTLRKICAERNSTLIEVAKQYKIKNITYNQDFVSFDLSLHNENYPQIHLSLLGEHQYVNAILAIASAQELMKCGLKITTSDIYRGLANVQWPGRMQLVKHTPRFIVDVAHNPNGIRALLKTISKYYTYNKLIILVGVIKTKDFNTMMKLLSQKADHIIIAKPDSKRAMDTESLAGIAKKYNDNVDFFQHVTDGIRYIDKISEKNDLIIGTGSHYTVGEIIKYYKKP